MYTQQKRSTTKEENKMTHYTFIKDGLRYTTSRDDLYTAKKHLEYLFHIDLSGATYEERFKNRIVATGKVR